MSNKVKNEIPIVISVSSVKGGVGKSTIVSQLAIAFVNLGFKVEVMDSDPNECSMVFRQARSVLAGKDDYIASVNRTRSLLGDIVQKSCDIIIIDCAGDNSPHTSLSMAAATYGLLILPFIPSFFDMVVFEKSLKAISDAKMFINDAPIPVFALQNNVPVSTKRMVRKTQKHLDGLQEEYEFQLFDTVIHSRAVLSTSIGEGYGVLDEDYKYSDKGAKERAKAEIISLRDEIMMILDMKVPNKK